MRDMKSKPEFLPPAIPKDLADRIIRLHGDPVVWWIGQFLKYILRPRKSTTRYLRNIEKQRNDQLPMVGLHIRRTDKLEKEAQFHSVEEYMEHVVQYFKILELKCTNCSSIKQVYISSDDPIAIVELKSKFPRYTFIGDESRAKSASTSNRYSLDSLQKLVADIHMLSSSDFIVCTFSSNMCRLAYEIQQQRYADGSWRFKSLDDIWYYAIKWDIRADHTQEAIFDHFAKSPNQINFKVGDIIKVETNLWNGYNKGRNNANGEGGHYPLYKMKERLKIVPFPRL